MWVTRPERPKGAKDEVKRPEGPPARSRGPEGPYTSSLINIWPDERSKDRNNQYIYDDMYHVIFFDVFDNSFVDIFGEYLSSIYLKGQE